MYSPPANSWMYYSARNGLDGFKSIGRIFFLGKDTWTAAGNGTDGFYIIEDNTLYATIYGQVGGTVVTEASLDALKKAKTKKVTVYRRYKKKKKWKWKVTMRTRTSAGWYKALNLPAGTTYKIKVQGKKAKAITVYTGDPYRLNFR